MNDWFDIMNSTIETINKPGKVCSISISSYLTFIRLPFLYHKEPYGSALASQENILERINEIMSTPIIPNYNDIELFQIGVIITNNSLQMLHSYLKEHYMDSILTERLSKDVVEDFVKIVCIKDVNPTTKEFKHRLRRYILGEYF